MISAFFIDRPVLANVLAILTLLIGGVALAGLPIAQYPDVVPPTVQVSTRFPGASALDVMRTVALPIEQQVNGVQDMLYMQSSSTSDGSYALIVTFAIGTDLNFAQVLVQNRVSSALAQLPDAVQSQGVTVQKKSTAILQIVALASPDGSRDSLYLSNYAAISLKDEISRVPGVGNVNVFGAGQYAMRVWLDPGEMQARGLTTQDVAGALQQQSQVVSAGQVGAPPTTPGQSFQYTLTVAGRLDQVEQFEDVIVKVGAGGAVTRLRDVARIELGAQSYGQVFTLDGKPAAGMSIFQTPGANALDVARAVDARMGELARAFPPGVRFSVPFDTTAFVRTSIGEVYWTLGEAAVLVLAVILVFLQDWRAMLVPATTVPVTIVGAFAAMAALGFSVNLSTLFAIVLAIGIVVDDAIVVVEGAARHLEQGLTPRDAAVRAMQDLFGPIIGITLMLLCVFIPASFLPGLTGRLYAQFALVIAATAMISAINAVTLKPTQCAAWLRPQAPPGRRNAFYRIFNGAYARLERGYAALIGRMVHRSVLFVALGLLLAVAGIGGIASLPTSFLPLEDQGYMLVSVQLPGGASLERTQRALDRVGELAHAVPGVAQIIGIAGISVLDNNAPQPNAGVAYVMLDDWGARGSTEGLRAIYGNLNAAMDQLDEAQALVIVPPAIQGIGNAGGFTAMIELRDRSDDFVRLQAVTAAVIDGAKAQPAVQRAASSFRADAPQLAVEVDRVKAETVQVNVGDVFQALSAYLGSSFVGQVTKFGRTLQIYTQADARFRALPEDVAALTVRNAAGRMIPLGALVSVTQSVGPSLIGLYNLYPSAAVVGSAADGFSSGQALDAMDQVMAATLPPGTGSDWTAMSYQERAIGNQIYVVFALAILLVYLVLAGQYESWQAPFSVILAVPLSLTGPVAALGAAGASNNLYTQIGLVLLIALSAKNAILIVETARDARARGLDVLDAAVEAARTRLRPILMTSFAFALGVLPLALATGAGANARKSIGITVFSGMLASTCLAVLFVPSFFVVLQRIEERRSVRPAPARAVRSQGEAS